MATPGEILIKEGDVLEDFETLTPDLTNPSLQITYKRCDGFNETVTGTATFEICTKDPSSTTFDTRFWKVEKVGPCEDSDGPDFPPDDPQPGDSNCRRFTVTNTDVEQGRECSTYNIISTGPQGLLVPTPLPVFVPGALLPRTRVIFIDCNNTIRFIKIKNRRGSVETVCSRIEPIAITGRDSIYFALQVLAEAKVKSGAADPDKIEGQIRNLQLKSIVGSQPTIIQLGSCGGGGSQGRTFTINYTDSNNTAQTATIKPGETVTVNATDKFEGEVLIRENRGVLSVLSLGTCEDINEDQDGEDEEEDDIDVDTPDTGLQVLELKHTLPQQDFIVRINNTKTGLLTIPVELEGSDLFNDCGIKYEVRDVPEVTDKSGRQIPHFISDVQVTTGTNSIQLSSASQNKVDELVKYVADFTKASRITVIFILEPTFEPPQDGSPYGNTDDVNKKPD
jgi:hypothetical protein